MNPTSSKAHTSGLSEGQIEPVTAYAAWHPRFGWWLPSVRLTESGASKQTFGADGRRGNFSEWIIVPITITPDAGLALLTQEKT